MRPGNNMINCSKSYQIKLRYTYCIWGLRWHSGLGVVLQIGKSLVQFQTVSFEIFH